MLNAADAFHVVIKRQGGMRYPLRRRHAARLDAESLARARRFGTSVTKRRARCAAG
jgi:hypothetical protein